VPRDRLNMQLVLYEGVVVAVAGATRFHLAPQLAELDDRHPLVMFVAVMCAYAERVRREQLPGPYTEDEAQLFARAALIDDGEFRHLDANGLDDLLLAGHFQVPVDQVGAKRRDLADMP
jgi:hypothetical protein